MAAEKSEEGRDQKSKKTGTLAERTQTSKPFQEPGGKSERENQYEKIPLHATSEAETAATIHELRMRNEELVESNKRLQRVLECGSAGTWNWDVQAERIEWNEQMYEMVGLSPDVREITVEAFFHYIHPKDLPRVQENIAKALESGTDFREMFRIVREDGEVRWLSGRGRVFRDEQAKPVRMMGVHVDITERQQTAEAVRLERQKLKNILDSIPDAVYIVNRQGEIEYVNPEMEKQRGSWAGKKCHQYRVGRDGPCTSCKFDQIRSGETVRAEWTDEKIGKTYDCIDTPLTNPDGSVSKLKIMRDVTEAKRAKEKLQQEHREIRLANRILEMFVNETGNALYDKVLGLLLDAMKSQYGVFGYVDEQKSLICPTMSRVLDECEMADKCVRYTRDNWKGLWGRALLEQRTLYTNDAPVIPTGHLPIHNNMATPILFQGEAIGLFNFANKAGGYTEQDRRFIEAMAARIAPVLYAWVQRELREKEREQAEAALRETKNELERNVAQLRTTFDSLTEGLIISDLDGNLFHWNPAAVAMHGFSNMEECRRKLPEFAEIFELSTEADGVLPVERWPLARILRGETLRNWEVHLHRCGSNWHRIFNYGGTLARDKAGKPLLAVVSCVDITERKQAENALRLHEARLEALLELNKMEGASRAEILDFVREEAIKIAQSEFAFIGFMNEDESIMSTDSWSKEVMKQCMVVDQPMHFPMAEAGLWGEVVRQRKAIVVNDYPAHGSKRGYPQGHVPIKRFLSVPVFDRNRIVAVAAVANKQENYEESDVRALTSMMNDMWRLIQRRRATEQIENMARFPSENPFPVLRIAEDGTIIYSNDAGSALLSNWGRQVGELAPHDWCQLIGEVLDSNQNEIIEAMYEKRVVSFVLAPVTKAGYVNIYGRDVTEQKKAEQALKEAHDDLEEKVRQRTAELSDVVSALQKEARERSLAQRELLQSESRLRDAQRIAHIGNWDWDIVKNTLWWSDEVHLIFGLEPQQFGATNEAFLSCVHPEDREPVKEAMNEAVCNHKTHSIGYRVVRPDGSERIAHEQAEVLYDKEEKAIRMMGTVQDVTEFKRAEERILADQVALRSLTSELQLAEERERRRLARDLHDSLGQILAMSKREIVGLQKSAPAKTAASLKTVANQLDQAITEARTLSFELSPSVLYDLGFEVALEELAERFSRERKIDCRFENNDEPKPLEEAIAVLLYRSVRELLINVTKHADATTAKISLERIENKLHITVEDNGDGFDVSVLDSQSRQPKGFGVLSVRERLRHIGGHFEIQSGNGSGTKVTLVAPLRDKENMKQDTL
ncbi:MAG: hypothetical protein CEE38_16570 [Planctomycetes bacterium B3_Pla]|nr:MAG: hypothetical protein CEE38_16570 [Planctomycetes bacterium B3_Pla]